MKTYLECWTGVAEALFSQALAGEPQLVDSIPRPMAEGSFGFAATLSGDQQGRFAVVLDAKILDAPLLGEGVDQKAGWAELLREVADAAVGELLAKTGAKCRIESFEETAGESKVSRAFQLKSGDRAWTILVRDENPSPGPREPQRDRRSRRRKKRRNDPHRTLELRLPDQCSALEWSCFSMSNSRPHSGLAAGRCRWERFSTSAQATWWSWTVMCPNRWTSLWETGLWRAVRWYW